MQPVGSKRGDSNEGWVPPPNSGGWHPVKDTLVVEGCRTATLTPADPQLLLLLAEVHSNLDCTEMEWLVTRLSI